MLYYSLRRRLHGRLSGRGFWQGIKIGAVPELSIIVMSIFFGATTGLTPVFAQNTAAGVIGSLEQLRPSEERPALPKFGDDSAAPGFILPPVAPPPSEQAPLSAQLKVYVNSYRIEGSTVFSAEELQQVWTPYAGRVVTSDELQQLRYELTLLYINNGYINSGVIIPDQQVVDGVIRLQVIEGELTRIDVSGQQRLDPEYITERIDLGDGKPLNINSLRQNLQLLQQNVLIRRINSRLEPGAKPGESVLSVEVEEGVPFRLGLTVDNHRSPSIGSIRGEIDAAHLNLSGRGDSLALRYGITEGLDDFGIRYALPLTARDLTLSLEYEQSDSDVVEEPFDAIDIASETRDFSIGLRYPVIKTLNRTFDLSLKLEKRKSETFLLGDPFSFSDGVDDGESKVTVVRLVADWVDRSEDQVIAARSTLSWGLDAWDATVGKGSLSGGEPDGKFIAWLGQFQWARRFGENDNQMIFRTDAQLSRDPLLPLEQFAVGGAASVRGFRENELVRDNGWVSSVEFRIPVLRDEAGASRTQLAAFVDYGRAWNENRDTPEPKDISSAGLGVLWNPTDKLYMELYGALPFRNLERNEHDLQDSGIHFLLSYRFY